MSIWQIALVSVLLRSTAPTGALDGVSGGAGELPEARRARVVLIVAEASAVAAERPWRGWAHEQQVALILAVTRAESGGFRRDVHAGEKLGDRGRSICLGQIMWGKWLAKRMTREQWLTLGGVSRESTRACLTEVNRQLGMHRNLCKVWAPTRTGVARLVSSYGTGAGCDPVRDWAPARAEDWSRLAAIRP